MRFSDRRIVKAGTYGLSRRLGLEAQNSAADIKLRARRRAGELIAEMPKQGPGDYKRLQPATVHPTLSDLGIGGMAASRWQAIARLPEEEFEPYIEQTKDSERELTTGAGLRFSPVTGHCDEKSVVARGRDDAGFRLP